MKIRKSWKCSRDNMVWIFISWDLMLCNLSIRLGKYIFQGKNEQEGNNVLRMIELRCVSIERSWNFGNYGWWKVISNLPRKKLKHTYLNYRLNPTEIPNFSKINRNNSIPIRWQLCGFIHYRYIKLIVSVPNIENY